MKQLVLFLLESRRTIKNLKCLSDQGKGVAKKLFPHVKTLLKGLRSLNLLNPFCRE